MGKLANIALVLVWYCIAILEPWYCIGIVLLEKKQYCSVFCVTFSVISSVMHCVISSVMLYVVSCVLADVRFSRSRMKGNSGLVPEMLICPPILDNSPVAIYFPSPDSVSKMQIKYIFHRI